MPITELPITALPKPSSALPLPPAPAVPESSAIPPCREQAPWRLSAWL
ncbi:hypothetical protein [Gordonia terrae]